jgi:hypothetical protein
VRSRHGARTSRCIAKGGAAVLRRGTRRNLSCSPRLSTKDDP